MSWIPTATLFAMMLSLGMTLRPSDFRRLGRAPRAVVFGLVGQLLLLPALAFGIAHGLGLDPSLAIGLVLIAACPGGVTSNVLAHYARGDVALSIALTATSSLASFLSVPVLTLLALRSFGGSEEAAITLSPTEMGVTLFGTTALPVLLGMAVLGFRPALAARLQRPLLNGSAGVLLLLIVGLGVRTWGSEHDITSLAVRATPAVVLLLTLSMAFGVVGARALGVEAAATRTLALEIGVQNFNLALVVALGLLGEPRYAGAALIYLPVMGLAAAAVVAWGRRDPGGGADIDGHRPALSGEI